MGIIGGGSYNKGNNGANTSISRSSSSAAGSGRPYGMMLLIAFGAALLGVMVLHKLREKRIYSLVVQQKDRDFYSLHLILQKERDYNRELKRENEEKKAKIYTLRTQKMELDRRLLEMQSTIDSLKDELKTMEVAVEEKLNEIKMLREGQDQMGNNNERENDNPEVVALVESLKQKEAEIVVLKHRLEYPEKVWSVSSDDPSSSSLLVNVTAEGQRGKSGEDGEKRVDQDESRNEVGNGDRREMIGKRFERFENVQDQSVEDDGVGGGGSGSVRTEDANDDTSSSIGEENSVANSARTNGQLEKDHPDNGEDHRETAKGGRKLEIRASSENGVRSTARGKHSFVGNSKGKRWRSIAKNRVLETRSVKFSVDGRGGLKNRGKRATFNRQVPLVSSNQQLDGWKAESDPDSLKSDNSAEAVASHYSIVDQKAENRKSKDEAAIGSQQDMNRKRLSKDRKYDDERSEDLKAADAQELGKPEGDHKPDSDSDSDSDPEYDEGYNEIDE